MSRVRRSEMASLIQLQPGAVMRVLAGEGPAFALLCLYLFIEYVRPQSIYPAIDILPYAQLSILAALGARLLTRERIDVASPTTFWLVAFLAVLQVSWWNAYNPALSGERVTTHVVWVVVYFLIVSTVNTRERFFVFLLLYLLWNLKMSQHGVRAWAARGFGYDRWGVSGGPGWFDNAGDLGVEMCIFLPVAFCFFLFLKKRCSRWKQTALAMVPMSAALTILATNSRGALVGMAAIVLWVGLASRKRFRFVVLAIMVSIAAYAIIPEKQISRIEASGEDETSNNRILRWGVGIEIMMDKPWTGVGPANWVIYYPTHYPPEKGLEMYGLQHSMYIDAASEYGVPGVVVLFGIIFSAFMANAKTRNLGRALGDEFFVFFSLGLDAALVGLLVSAAFVSVFNYPFLWVHVAFIVALNKVAAAAYVRHEATAPAVAGAVTQALTTGGRTWRRA
ncbi:hypothetical protein KBTX_03958 [wastewater metagenome]|uniref:O-antigen ligase-related domain-containing protein n=2 Tax=unclassified sequences TaxID=12908 RepID=A0A5B8REY5_9ZZZZ|nr:O-antigen ligase family protein [Arhodomonas sp. KWT]QEA07599.1 hypothetical protein KBTEX_03958 [uncultured organism]